MIEPNDLDLNEILKASNDKVAWKKLEETFSQMKDQMLSSNYVYHGALIATFNKVLSNRKEAIDEINQIKDYYIAQVLREQIISDALAPDINSGEILEISSSDNEINDELINLQDRINLDQLILDISPELLTYGEYCLLPNIEKGKGVISIDDAIDGEYISALSSQGDIRGFLVPETTGNGFIIEPKHKYINFCLLGEKQRIRMSSDTSIYSYSQKDKDKFKGLPSYIRAGKSIYYKVIDKVKELQLLETLIPATRLAQLTNGSLVGVKVPETYDTIAALKYVQSVENTINKKVGIDPTRQQITIQNLINASGRLKCVPIFGSNGDVSKLDYKMSEPQELLGDVKNLREVICTSIGVPYELVFGSIDSLSSILKRHSRYIRKLRSFQFALTSGLTQMLLIHFGNLNNPKFKNIVAKDFLFNFKQKQVEIDNLDRLEFVDANVSLVKNLMSFIGDLEQNPYLKDALNKSEIAKMISGQLSILGMNIIDENKLEELDKIQQSIEPICGLKSTDIINTSDTFIDKEENRIVDSLSKTITIE
jgi:hypothetical protein